MKLIVTIPAYNEEATLAAVIDSIPKKIPGIKSIGVLVIDDGSTDKTAEIALKKGCMLVQNRGNKGLAYTFRSGLEEALRRGADIIVNTDGDNQYDQQQIPALVAPILQEKADIVLGSRFRGTIEYMPWQKRLGNSISSWIVRRISSLPVTDAQTGFRAFSRDAALRMNIQSTYTYTQETILQAAAFRLTVAEVPITFKKRYGKSRLVSSVLGYARRASTALVMGYLNYRPLRIFLTVGLLFFLSGCAIGVSILDHFLRTGLVSPYIPSAILTAILLLFGFQIMMIGMLAEMIKGKRLLQDETLYRLKKKKEFA